MPARLPIAESLCQSPGQGDVCVMFDVSVNYRYHVRFRLNRCATGRTVNEPPNTRGPNVPPNSVPPNSVPPSAVPPSAVPSSSGKRVILFVLRSCLTGVVCLGLVVVHARDIAGNILRPFHTLPSTTERVPSLGALADELLDAFGYLESAVITFRDAYFAAQATGSDTRVHFVQTLAEHGMAQKEASIWFTILQSSIADSGNTSLGVRYRPSLESE